MDAVLGPDGRLRCPWALSAPDFLHYHDTEWGFPVQDDTRLFEKLSLEAFQSGLSWRTILAKRENFRTAFAGFDATQVARFGAADIKRLLADAGIVRHRGKIEAVIHNATRVPITVGSGTLADFVWRYAPATRGPRTAPVATTPESVRMAKDLKKLGWKFVGPTTVYAFMQAMGLVNDHVESCLVYAQAEAARAALS